MIEVVEFGGRVVRREAIAGRIDERTGQRVTVYREVVDWDSVDWGPPKWSPNGKRYGPPARAEVVRPEVSPRTGLPKGGGEDKPAVEHPTLLDIAVRQEQIDDWHQHVDTFRRQCTRATWNLSAFGTAAIGVPFIFGIANNLGLVLLVLLSGLSYVAAAFCHRAKGWKDWDACGEPLELHKWNVAENSAALKTQEPEVFLSACACPGCGDVEVHQFRKKLSIDPDWASVIRRCATCDREWAQK